MAQILSFHARVVEHVPVGIIHLSQTGLIDFAHPEACRVLGDDPTGALVYRSRAYSFEENRRAGKVMGLRNSVHN